MSLLHSWVEASYLLVSGLLFLYLWRTDVYRDSPDGVSWQGWLLTKVGWKDILLYFVISAAWPVAVAVIGFWWVISGERR